jgi:uncharacterized membrane protein
MEKRDHFGVKIRETKLANYEAIALSLFAASFTFNIYFYLLKKIIIYLTAISSGANKYIKI